MKILLTAVLVLLVSSCLIREERSGTKISFDADGETPTSFEDCLNIIEKADDKSELLRMKFHACTINLGIYPAPSPLRLAANGKSYQTTPNKWLSSTLEKFMDINSISCEKIETKDKSNATLRFKFPTKDVGHQDYKHVDIKCPMEKKSRVVVNLSIFTGKDLGLSVLTEKSSMIFKNSRLHFDLQFGKNVDSATYHFFNTNKDGVIEKHVKVRGRKGKEEVILKDYVLQ